MNLDRERRGFLLGSSVLVVGCVLGEKSRPALVQSAGLPGGAR
jgi:hypothetical protein